MTLGQYLKLNGIKLTAFSNSIGEKVQTVHGWVNGRRRPSIVSLVAIERATDGAVRAVDFLPAEFAQPGNPPSSAKAA